MADDYNVSMPDDDPVWCKEEIAQLQGLLRSATDQLAASREEAERYKALWQEVGQHIDRAAIGWNHPQIAATFAENRNLRAKLQKAVIDAERLRAAMEQYADPENWMKSDGDRIGDDVWIGEGDNGYDVAVAALSHAATKC